MTFEKSQRSGGATHNDGGGGGGGTVGKRTLIQELVPAQASGAPVQMSKHKPEHDKHDEAPRPLLTKYDYEHFSEVLSKYADYARGDRHPAIIGQDDEHLSHLCSTVMAILELAHAGPDGIKAGIDLWSSNKKKISAVIDEMRAGGAEDGFIRQAREAYDDVEDYLLAARTEAMLDARTGDNLVGEPDDAVVEAGLAAAPEALEQVYELLGKSIEAGEPYVEAMNASGTKTKVETSMASVKLVLGLVQLPGDIKEKVAEFKKAGMIGKAATATDMLNTVLSVMKDGCEAGVAAGKWLGGITELGEAAETFTQLGQMVGKLEKAGKVLGTITAILGIATSALQLIDGIQRGDKKAIAKASVGLVEGGMGLLMAATEVGAGPAAAAVWYFTCVEGLIDGVGTILDTLNSAAARRELAAVQAMIGDASRVAQMGARMAAAWDLSAQGAQATADASLNATATARFDAEAERLAKYVAAGIRGLSVHAHTRDLDHVGGYDELTDALGHDATALLDGDDMDLDHPSAMLLTFDCQKVFGGINAMSKVAIARAQRQGGDE